MESQLDGRKVARERLDNLKKKIEEIMKVHPNFRPVLHFIQVGINPSGNVFQKLIKKAIDDNSLPIDIDPHELDSSVTEEELIQLIAGLNEDGKESGIIIVQPLKNEKPINLRKAIETIDLLKDIEGLRYENFEKLLNGQHGISSPTAEGCVALIKSTGINLPGKHAVVLTSSTEGLPLIQGNPVVQLLRLEGCAVTYLDPFAENAPSITKLADIVVAMAGRSKQVNSNWIKDSQTIVIGGIKIEEDGTRTGYVDTEDVKGVTKWVSPVIGGIGPVLIAELLVNAVDCALAQKQRQQHG